MKTYRMGSFGTYAEGVGTLKAAGGDLGGGSETLVVMGGSNEMENVERLGDSSNAQYTKCGGGSTDA